MTQIAPARAQARRSRALLYPEAHKDHSGDESALAAAGKAITKVAR